MVPFTSSLLQSGDKENKHVKSLPLIAVSPKRPLQSIGVYRMEPVSLWANRSLAIFPVLKVVNSDILISHLKLPSPKAALSGSSESGLSFTGSLITAVSEQNMHFPFYPEIWNMGSL